jgi:hypothetical protein
VTWLRVPDRLLGCLWAALPWVLILLAVALGVLLTVPYWARQP